MESKSLEPEVQIYQIDPEAERKLVRKLDWMLLPLFTLICESSPLCHLSKKTHRPKISVISSTGLQLVRSSLLPLDSLAQLTSSRKWSRRG
jgi:hypothetical protein